MNKVLDATNRTILCQTVFEILKKITAKKIPNCGGTRFEYAAKTIFLLNHFKCYMINLNIVSVNVIYIFQWISSIKYSRMLEKEYLKLQLDVMDVIMKIHLI